MKRRINSRKVQLVLGMLTALTIAGCDWKPGGSPASILTVSGAHDGEAKTNEAPPAKEMSAPERKALAATAEEIMARPQVPVLCYHQVRDYRPTDSRSAKDYIVPPAVFQAQMKALADSGYTTILPDQLQRYLLYGEELPAKPVMITFDDGCDEQYTVAKDVLQPLQFKAAFFIMTVSMNRPNFMSAEQIRDLHTQGHTIGLHTWDHHSVKQYEGEDWQKQVEQPRLQLEKIIGQQVKYFAYPFGLWNKEAIPHLKDKGLEAAYQLSTARDSQEPLYTIRRIIVPGEWGGAALIKRMNASFD
ncbi:polysaccharide deacetylase family protein [Flavihumibacter rivuli]|uniref:polysaccharide deacetylase family protein n=1 Tax=Flavihumibacter rivuli TaxID=2838156 RepID=UPI001EFA5AE0|nr:polysaccharide deacetylase family protein [Flavihumibacter rivuli]ULQ57328.1 polysaccharide deacetylase family protein [Flavihumibacter rivuli]